jgi:hypothetical protein
MLRDSVCRSGLHFCRTSALILTLSLSGAVTSAWLTAVAAPMQELKMEQPKAAPMQEFKKEQPKAAPAESQKTVHAEGALVTASCGAQCCSSATDG